MYLCGVMRTSSEHILSHHEAQHNNTSTSGGREMKRMPSFSSRPGFPLGLRVLVVDESAEEAESMLKACGFNPVSCRSSREALRIISTGTHQVDVLLVDAGCLARKSPESTALLSWARTLPLVLMAKGQAEMVSGITKQGAGMIF